MNDDRLLVIAARQRGVVTRGDVAAAELTSAQWCYRLQTEEWVDVAPGVWRHRATPVTWEMQLQAGLLHLGSKAAIFGQSATAWWELDDAVAGKVEFVVPRRRRERALPRNVHTTTAWDLGDVLVHRGLRVTTVTRTILDLAAVGASPRLIEAAIDSGVRRRLTAVPVIARRARDLAKPGRRGTSLILELLLDSGGESRLERRFLRLMRQRRLPTPRCQVIFRHGTRTVARVDFLFAGTNVVVEVSGRLGHASDEGRRKDARRRNELWLLHGLNVVEFTTADVVEDPEYVVATVRRALGEASLVAS
ncbi:MAG: DUF559 domain-containing protein [Ilumatobacteraceae bacterium]